MPIHLSYIAVVLIWSTTPLAIKLSNDSVAPIIAVSSRMLIAASCASVVMLLWRRREFFRRANVAAYFAGSLALFPTMPMVYYAAETIPSGLISILFGMAPFITAIFAWCLLGENLFTRRTLAAQALALVGFALVSSGQVALDSAALEGLALMLAAVACYAFSNVWVKRISLQAQVAPPDQSLGGMLFSLPGLLLCWWFIGGEMPGHVTSTSLGAIAYLALVGSVLGYLAFYTVVNGLGVGTVALIPVITPVFALFLGSWLAGEALTRETLAGAGLIMTALLVYQQLPGRAATGIRTWVRRPG